MFIKFIYVCPRCKHDMEGHIYYDIRYGGFAEFYNCEYCGWQEEIPVGLKGLLKK